MNGSVTILALRMHHIYCKVGNFHVLAGDPEVAFLAFNLYAYQITLRVIPHFLESDNPADGRCVEQYLV